MTKGLLKDKRLILFLSILALLSLVLLATAIKNATFLPAQHFSQVESDVAPLPVGEVIRTTIIKSIISIPLEKQITLLVMLLLFVMLVLYLLPPEMRKKLFKQFLRVGLGVLLLLYLLKKRPDLFEGLLPIFSLSVGQSSSSQVEAAAPPTFEPPQISGWISFFITLAVILLTSVILWRISRWWALRTKTSDALPPLEKIAGIAHASLKDLETGRNSEDAIVKCYERMSAVVGSKQGLRREIAMTSSEFASRLERSGLPHEAVSRLTYLFESVRYGGHLSGPRETAEAISCLSSILQYCGEAL